MRAQYNPDTKNFRVTNFQTVNAVRKYFRNEKIANYGIHISSPIVATKAIDYTQEPWAEPNTGYIPYMN